MTSGQVVEMSVTYNSSFQNYPHPEITLYKLLKLLGSNHLQGDDTVLVAFTNQIIKDNNFLVVHWKLFKWNNFNPAHFYDLVTSKRVNICSPAKNYDICFGGGFSKRYMYQLCQTPGSCQSCDKLLIQEKCLHVGHPAASHQLLKNLPHHLV